MDRLIDSDYFVGDIEIPNVDNTDVLANLNRVIDQTQKSELIYLLGYSLNKKFEDGLDEVSPAQKWLDLRDGADYTFTYNGTTYNMRWEGLKNTTDYISLIAYFSFFNYMKNSLRLNTGDSITLTNTENGVRSENNYKLITAWNKGFELYGSRRNLAKSGNRVQYVPYSNLPIINASGSYYPENRFEQSAFNFIWEMNDQNGDDYYENWIFTDKESINEFGI